MVSNSRRQRVSGLYRQTDKMLLEHACEKYIDKVTSQYPSPEELEDNYSVSVSPKFNCWVKEMIGSENKRLRRKAFNEAIVRHIIVAKKVAIVICFIFAASLLLAFTVPPIRVEILNFITQINEDYAEMDLVNNDQEISSTDYNLNLPEGFEVTNITEQDTILIATVINYTGNVITIERYFGSIGSIIDNEESGFEKC